MTECLFHLKYSSPYKINQNMHVYKHFKIIIIIIIVIVVVELD
jgi:hypothetical protein